MHELLLYLFAACCFVSCIRIDQVPECDHDIRGDQVTGKWYVFAIIPSYSWVGEGDLTDVAVDVDFEANYGFIVKVQWRDHGTCTYTTNRNRMQRGSVNYLKVKDSIGDSYSRDLYMISCDTTCFGVTWGCRSFNNTNYDLCLDHDVYVYTRDKYPTQQCKETMNDKLDSLWGIDTNDMITINHNNPCERMVPVNENLPNCGQTMLSSP